MIKSKAVLLHLFILPFVLYLFASCYNPQEGRVKNFQAQLGTYVLDIHKTTLGVYSKDSNSYKNLHIVFKADSSFNMNMSVPFMYDSLGKWKAGNMKEWNYLWYKQWGYVDFENGRGNQFTRPYIASDSNEYFLINAATPKDGFDFIQEIYFRKVGH
jgi:hypothetical protein